MREDGLLLDKLILTTDPNYTPSGLDLQESQTGIADQTTDEDAVFSFVVPANTFADVDVGVTLTYSATLNDDSVLPAWLTFDVLTQTFTGTPTNDDVGTIDVKVTASDGTADISDTFTLTINNTNDAPILDNVILPVMG